MREIEKLYLAFTGERAAQVVELPSSGSNRRYFRMSDSEGKTLIGAVGTSIEENKAFWAISEHFSSKAKDFTFVLYE